MQANTYKKLGYFGYGIIYTGDIFKSNIFGDYELIDFQCSPIFKIDSYVFNKNSRTISIQFYNKLSNHTKYFYYAIQQFKINETVHFDFLD